MNVLRITAGLLIGLLNSSLAFADPGLYTGAALSGSQLATICDDEHHQANDTMWTVCVSYVDGIVAGYTSAVSTAITYKNGLKSRPALGDDKTIESLLSVLTSMYCIPATSTRLQNAEVVTKYLKDHQEELSYPANQIVLAAFAHEWPCNK